MTSGELITVVTREIKGLSTQFVEANFTDAVDEATRETGFTLPNTNDDQLKWLKSRTTRHLIYMLWLENSVKFKVKNIALDQKFEHLHKMLAKMDKDWEAAKEDPLMGVIVDDFQQFGHRIGSGFASDDLGRDITYNEEQLVIVSPNEND
jgi:hypothetical protein